MQGANVGRISTISSTLFVSLMGLSLSVAHCTAETRTATPASQPGAQIKPTTLPSDVPAHCIGGRKPGSIGETEKRTILEAARKLEPERRVWFIANGRTWIDRFEVYFLPDEVNGRARKGKAMAFSYRDEAQARAWLPGRDRKVEIFDYVQVGDEPPENFEPRPQNMPFRMPKGLTLAEVDEIVARIQSNEKLPDSKTLPLEINHKYPILHINRQGDEVEVTTGFSRGMLNGNGEILRFKKENGKWVIRDMAWWVS